MSRRLAVDVERAGGTVVSGLAHGIDAAAHDAAPAHTIAVLGQGLARPLSRAQGQLADRIEAAGGLLVSEFLPSTPAGRHTFPQRNRVIAGLSVAVVIVEAGARSGALITARVAGELGREVLVVPRHPLSANAEGCLRLLRQGATLVATSDDLLDAVPQLRRARVAQATRASTDPVVRAIGPSGATFDDLLCATGLSVPILTRRLVALELGGLLQRGPGERYTVPSAGG